MMRALLALGWVAWGLFAATLATGLSRLLFAAGACLAASGVGALVARRIVPPRGAVVTAGFVSEERWAALNPVFALLGGVALLAFGVALAAMGAAVERAQWWRW